MADNDPNSSSDLSGLSDLGDLQLTTSTSSENPGNHMDMPDLLKEMERGEATEQVRFINHHNSD